jgi:hypothetical protein
LHCGETGFSAWAGDDTGLCASETVLKCVPWSSIILVGR